MPTVNGKYLKDENSNIISPIVSADTIYDTLGNPMGGGIVPIGTILSYVGETAPSNYLICDGSAVSTDDYPLLCSVVPSSWISGSGTVFKLTLPDLRKRVILGKYAGDSTYGTIGKTGGEETHKLTINEMPTHRHNGLRWGNETGYVTLNSGSHDGYNLSYSGGNSGFDSLNTTYSGGGSSHNNMQPYIVLNYIIRAK